MFKVGDRVRCFRVNPAYTIFPAIGKVYKVVRLDNPSLNKYDLVLEIDGRNIRFYSKDFVLADVAPKANCGKFARSEYV